MFAQVGETLRRVRKERGKTLSQLAAEARVGKGQLSRIETGKQEVTLATLGRVLSAHGLSRQEFFRRYDLVEAEAGAVGRGGTGPPSPGAAASPLRWTDEVRTALGRIDDFLSATSREGEPLAQGGFEAGDYVVLFRVVARSAAHPDETTGDAGTTST